MTEAEARGAEDTDYAAALARAREQQAAVSDILRVISRSKDLQEVFDVIATSARRFCSAEDAMVALVEGDHLVGKAHEGDVGFVVGSAPLDRQLPAAGCIVEARTIHVRDMQTDPSEDFKTAREIAVRYGIHTVLATPMFHDGKAIGSITLRRTEVRSFTDEEIELVRTFADQAVIAIESVRLFNETKEALDQQTATNDVLKAISRSAFDLQAVFNVVLENATKLCRGEWAWLYRREGDAFKLIAWHGGSAALLDYERTHPTAITDRTLIGRVALRRSLVHIPDLFEDPNYDWPSNREQGVHTVLGVPIFRDDEVVGAIGVARGERRPFSEAEIRLVQTFADQATIAMENVRLFNETKESLERQTALAEILSVIADSPADQQPVVDAIARSTTRYCGAEDAAVFLLEGDMLRRVAHHGLLPVVSSPMLALDRGAVAGRAILERRTVHVADVAGAEGDDFLVTRARAAVTGQRGTLAAPMLREGSPIGVILLRKADPTGYTPSQIQLVEAFADQAVIAIENVRLFNETNEALKQRTATSEILRVISETLGDPQPVMQAIVDTVLAVCSADSAGFFRRSGDDLLLRAVSGTWRGPRPSDLRPQLPFHGDSIVVSALEEGRYQHVADTSADARYDAAAQWSRTRLAVPVLRGSETIGVIRVGRAEPGGFTDREIRLVEGFAEQAAIAFENARLFNETKEALERQSAVAEVLGEISQSGFQLQPVLESVIEAATKLCAAQQGFIYRREGDVFRLVVAHGITTEFKAFTEANPINPMGRGTVTGRVAEDGRTVHIPDVLADPEYTYWEAQRLGNFRSILGVPMKRDDQVIGVMLLWRTEPQPFADDQIALVTTFANQASIAIENVRLFGETTEALERQTATADVLRVIAASPTEVQPVLDAIADRAMRLCAADGMVIRLIEGNELVVVARAGTLPAREKGQDLRIPLRGDTLTGAATLEARTIHVADVQASKEYPLAREMAVRGRHHTIAAVPLLREGRAIGVFSLARQTIKPYSEKELALVATFADQAVIAIENVRLFNETKEALERQTAISEVLKVISRTTFDILPVMRTVLAHAARLCDADLAWMRRVDSNGALYESANYGRTSELTERLSQSASETREAYGSGRASYAKSIMARVINERTRIHLADIALDPDLYENSVTARINGARTVLAVPLLHDGDPVGMLVVARMSVRPFDEREQQLVDTFAQQAAIAMQNARLFTEIQDKSRQLEVASRHKSEFLANMSHELRTPLNAIIGFSEVLVQGLFGDVNEKQREYLQDVIGSGQHLLSLINDILDLSKIEAGRMELELSTFNFRDALQSGMTIVRERASRHNITLSVVVADELGPVEADERKVKQIFYNLLSNAVKFTPDDGRVDVTVRRDNGDVRVEVRDTGIGIADSDQARIFEEFQQVGRERSREGTGLGLTLTKRFVELHGGRIWLESAPGQGSTFTFTLPLRQAAPVRA